MSKATVAVQGFVSLVARLALVAVFIEQSVEKMLPPNFTARVGSMKDEGVPNASFALFVAIGLVMIGGVSVMLGAWTRFGAIFLFVFLAAATFYYHDFWEIRDPFDPAITDPVMRDKVANVFARRLKLPADPAQLMPYRAWVSQFREYEFLHFMKNIAIGGGLLALIAFGGGPWSVDGWIALKQEAAESAAPARNRTPGKVQQAA